MNPCLNDRLIFALDFCYVSSKSGLVCDLIQFFEMPRHEAVKALDVYKRAGQQVIM